MERNSKTMRTGVMLVVLTLITACFVGGTLAKYVSGGNGTDTARVAKWGIDVIADTTGTFTSTYEGTDGLTVEASQDVVAPGTEGTLAGFNVTGSSEVDGVVTYKVDSIVLSDNWKADGSFYFPVTFNVNGEAVSASVTSTDTSALVAAINKKLATKSVKFQAGEGISADAAMNIGWKWAFEGENAKDTALGNAAADGNAPTITINVSATATQID